MRWAVSSSPGQQSREQNGSLKRELEKSGYSLVPKVSKPRVCLGVVVVLGFHDT